MTTKAQYIAEARKNNPKPQYRTENGERIELTEAEYEASLEAWAEMRIEQEAVAAAADEKAAAIVSARTKLANLGLTPAEIKALVG